MSYIMKPFSWMLLKFYELSGSYALALILFSFVIKLVLFPFFMKGKKSMMRMNRLAPKVKELEKKYKDSNQQKYAAEVQKLYKEENVSPMSGCIWNLIPFPFLIMLYSIIRKPITKLMGLAESSLETIADLVTKAGMTVADYTTNYGEMTLASQAASIADKVKAAVPGFVALDYALFGINLAENPRFLFFMQENPWTWNNVGLFLIPLISGAFALVQMLLSQKMNPTAQMEGQSNKTMLLMMPLISVWIGYAMPAAMSIYWIANSVFGIAQDVISTLHYRKVFAREDAVKLAAEEEKRIKDEEKKRLREEKIAAEGGPSRDKNTSRKKLQVIEREKAEEAERLYKERTGQTKTVKTDDDRPFARGRAYDPDRFAQQQPKAEQTNEMPEQTNGAEEESESAE